MTSEQCCIFLDHHHIDGYFEISVKFRGWSWNFLKETLSLQYIIKDH